jgi:hypothetical protein
MVENCRHRLWSFASTPGCIGKVRSSRRRASAGSSSAKFEASAAANAHASASLSGSKPAGSRLHRLTPGDD